MKLAYPSLLLTLLCALPLAAQTHYADGDRVISGNRLISVKSAPGRQLYQQEATPRPLRITLDARRTETDWASAPVVAPLRGAGGETDHTTVRVLHDAANIYLFWEVDQPDGLTANLKETDGVITGDDYVQIDLRPWLPDKIRYARNYYYTIAVNPAGKVWDSYFDPYLDGFFFSSWDSHVEVATKQEAKRWTAEMTIPFAWLDVYSDPGWRWQLRFHHASASGSGPASVTSADLGMTLVQETQVRRPALVAYYWQRPEFMEEVKPQPPVGALQRARAARLARVAAIDSAPDSGLWRAAPVLQIDHTDHMGQTLQANPARARVALADGHLCLNLEADGAKTQPPVEGETGLGQGMAAQTAGVNGVFVDQALFENECFWIIVQPRQQGSDGIHDDYYMIIVDNRGGVRGTHYDRYGAPYRSWKPKATVDLYNTAAGWGAEVALDLSSFNLPEKAASEWGFNIFRNRLMKKGGSELQAWRYTGSNFLAPATFGVLDGVGGVASARAAASRAARDDAQGIRDAAAYYKSVPHPVRGGYPLMDVQFIGEHGWAVGALGTILRTADGGQSWESVPVATDADLYRVDFVNEREGWAAGGRIRNAKTNKSMRHDKRGGYAYIFHTTDGGKTWECQYGERGRHLFGLDFVNEQVGYAAGERGFLLKTVDGGEHWTVIPTTGTLNWLYGLVFRDAMNGFAVGQNETVLRTRDGGRSWQRLSAEADRKPFGFRPIYRDIALAGATVCVVGQNGAVVISRDGGETWNPAATFFKDELRDLMDLRSVTFVTPKRGYAVGELGARILVTDDGGASWSYRPAPNTEWLRAVWADAEGRVVLTGERECVLRSADHGYTWKRTRGQPPKADVLVMMAHGDDAAINLSAFYAHYAINEKKTIVDLGTLSDLHSSEYEETYNLEHDRTMWMLGVRTSTNFNEFETGNNGSDYYHFTARLWKGEESVIRHMVAAIRAYRPDVVITHGGVFGDYDKPGHKLSGRAGLPAFERAGGDVDYYPELTRLGLKPWQPKKLYNLASESYPATLDLAPIGEKKLSGTEQSCHEFAEYVIRNFQSQGIYHVENGKLSLVKSLVTVPEKETSVFDGLE